VPECQVQLEMSCHNRNVQLERGCNNKGNDLLSVSAHSLANCCANNANRYLASLKI